MIMVFMVVGIKLERTMGQYGLQLEYDIWNKML